MIHCVTTTDYRTTSNGEAVYSVAYDAQNSGLGFCRDTKCPLLTLGCARAIVHMKKANIDRLPTISEEIKKIDERIARGSQYDY